MPFVVCFHSCERLKGNRVRNAPQNETHSLDNKRSSVMGNVTWRTEWKSQEIFDKVKLFLLYLSAVPSYENTFDVSRQKTVKLNNFVAECGNSANENSHLAFGRFKRIYLSATIASDSVCRRIFTQCAHLCVRTHSFPIRTSLGKRHTFRTFITYS